jgi:hypothetical protein
MSSQNSPSKLNSKKKELKKLHKFLSDCEHFGISLTPDVELSLYKEIFAGKYRQKKLSTIPVIRACSTPIFFSKHKELDDFFDRM